MVYSEWLISDWVGVWLLTQNCDGYLMGGINNKTLESIYCFFLLGGMSKNMYCPEKVLFSAGGFN